MSRPPFQHLDSDDIDALLGFPDGENPEADNQPSWLVEEAITHAGNCDECRQKLRIHREGHNWLMNLKFKQPDGSSAQCTEVVDWTAVVAGAPAPEQAQRHLEHAAQCARCGAHLKSALADFFNEATPEEEIILQSLRLASPQNRLMLAKKLQQEHKVAPAAPHRVDWRWLWLYKTPSMAFAATLLIVLSGTFAISRHRSSVNSVAASSPMELVASAYAERRTMDLRISGASYAPKVGERGADISSVDRPLPLQRAEVLIHEGLLKNADDANLLQAKARAELLDASGTKAIDSLNRALELQPGSISIRTDLASAFFTRAENSRDQTARSTIDYGQALDQLGQVLAKTPSDNVALFNRALVEDRLKMYHQEIADWIEYLRVEKDPGWRSEGDARYQQVLKSVENHEHSSGYQPPTPLAALPVIRARTTPDFKDQSDGPLDDVYLSEAITKWLPSMAPGLGPLNLSADDALIRKKVLVALGEELRVRHGDSWLRDLLAGSRSSTWQAAVVELSSATNANARGTISEIIPHSVRALQLFQKIGNPAGVAAARFEYLVGVNRSVQANLCQEAALDAIRASASHRYNWLHGYALFESSACNFMIGRQEAALQDARQATLLGRQFHFKTLELDGAYFLDGVATTSVATPDSWDRIEAGLAEFWNASYPPLSGEGFYSDLGYAAQREGLWHSAERIFQEALLVYAADGNEFSTASARQRLAEAAETAGDDLVAEAEYRKANQSLRWLGRSADLARTEFEIERAALETTQGKFDLAAGRLQLVEKDLSGISNHYALIPYYQSAGELHLRTGQAQQAEVELLEAIKLIEEDKSTLLSETDLLTWHRDMSSAYRSLMQVYTQFFHDDSKAFALLEWYKAGPVRVVPAQRSLNAATHHANAQGPELVQFLPRNLKIRPDTAVLTWIAFPDRISIFLLNKSGLHTASTSVQASDFGNSANRLLRRCSDPLSDRHSLDRDAGLLYQWLVQPIILQLSGIKEIEIEPDDSFPPIPFELLEDQQGNYLGDSFAVAESPGIGYTQLLRTNRQVSVTSTALVVGDPVVSSTVAGRFKPIPEANKEAVEVSTRFSRHFLLTGSEATVTDVVRLLPSAEVFHFAGHAVSQGNEMGLLLASSSTDRTHAVLLSQKELHGRDLKNLRLVILSGCRTGNAEWGLTDPKSLVRTFLRAGVPSIVASRWQIDSRSSAELMNQVYSRLMQGSSIENALATAKHTLRTKPNTAHPYYWAAFSVFGR